VETNITKDIKIEIAKSGNQEQLKRLYKEAGWWDEDDNQDPGLIDKIIQGSFCFAVATTGGRIIGMGRAISDGVCDAYIQDVTVLKEFRGRGIGGLIMDAIIKFLNDKNIGWISLISEPKAVSFYQKYGFSQMADYIPFTLHKTEHKNGRHR